MEGLPSQQVQVSSRRCEQAELVRRYEMHTRESE